MGATPASPTRPARSAFDQAITAQGAAEHGYALDPTWGFPTTFYGFGDGEGIEAGVSWCHPAATTTLLHDEIPDGLFAQRARWEATAPSMYTFVLDRLCFCGEVGPYVITVANGVRASITDADGTPVSIGLARQLPGTVEEVFDLVEASVNASDLVVATFDADLGHPVNVYVDSIATAIDDETTYIIREYETDGAG